VLENAAKARLNELGGLLGSTYVSLTGIVGVWHTDSLVTVRIAARPDSLPAKIKTAMTRVTSNLDATFLEQVRRRAASERKNPDQVASELLAAALEEEAPHGMTPLRWPSMRMGKPKVDLQDKEDLRRSLARKAFASEVG